MVRLGKNSERGKSPRISTAIEDMNYRPLWNAVSAAYNHKCLFCEDALADSLICGITSQQAMDIMTTLQGVYTTGQSKQRSHKIWKIEKMWPAPTDASYQVIRLEAKLLQAVDVKHDVSRWSGLTYSNDLKKPWQMPIKAASMPILNGLELVPWKVCY